MAKRLVEILLVLVAVFLVYEIATETVHRKAGSPTEVLKDARRSARTGTNNSNKDFSIIEKRNLFGLPDSGKPETGKEDTPARFRLRGTVISASGGYVILENFDTGKQKVYRAGDKAGSMHVLRIEWSKVVLTNINGKIMILRMNESPLPEETNETAVREEPAGISEMAETNENSRIIPRGLVETSITNANKILTQVRIRPHFVSGIAEGYRVSNIKPGSLIEEMGFRNGDIIREANGKKLDSPGKIFALYEEIQKTDKVTVEVKRANRLLTLTYQIRN